MSASTPKAKPANASTPITVFKKAA
jgi:hypothetical protein